MAAEIRDQHHATRRQAGGDVAQDLPGLRGVVQHHIDHDAVRLQARQPLVAGVAVHKFDVVQAFRGGAGSLEHGGGIVQRDHMVEPGGQGEQKTAVPGAHFQCRVEAGQRRIPQYLGDGVGILLVAGDEVLLLAEFVCVVAEEVA